MAARDRLADGSNSAWRDLVRSLEQLHAKEITGDGKVKVVSKSKCHQQQMLSSCLRSAAITGIAWLVAALIYLDWIDARESPILPLTIGLAVQIVMELILQSQSPQWRLAMFMAAGAMMS